MFQSLYTNIDGKLLYYEKYGKEYGKTIVAIHTAGTDGRMWREFAELLSSEYIVYVVDLPGHGKSDPFDKQEVKGITLNDYAVIIKVFMEKLALNNVIVVGCSIGADIALILSIIAQDRIRQALVIEGAAKTETFSKDQLEKVNPADVSKTYMYCGRKTRKERIDQIMWIKSTNSPKIYLTDLKAWNLFDVSHDLGGVKIPIILMRGEDDPFMSKEMIENTEKLLENCKTVNLDGFGHYPMTEDPNNFVDIVRSLIEQ